MREAKQKTEKKLKKLKPIPPLYLSTMWEEFMQIVADIDKDAVSNLKKGNIAAGKRFRSVMRKLRRLSLTFIRETINHDRQFIRERRKSFPSEIKAKQLEQQSNSLRMNKKKE